MIKKPKGRSRNRRLKDPLSIRAGRFVSRHFKKAAIMASVPAAAFGAWHAYMEVLRTEYLAVRNINVSGVERLAREEVVKLSGVAEGQNIFSFKKKDVLARIFENPWIEVADLKRSLPDTIEIEVVERRPVAFVRMDSLYVMDDNGVLFKKASGEDGLDLPVVTGLSGELMSEDPKGIQKRLLELIRTLSAREGFNLNGVSEISVDAAFGLTVLTVNGGVRLDVGMGEFEEKLAAFERVLKARGGTLEGIEAMDLNNRNEVTVRFTTDVVREGGGAHGQKG